MFLEDDIDSQVNRLSEGGFTSEQLAGEYKASEKLYIFVHIKFYMGHL